MARKINAGMMSSASPEWYTPAWLVKAVVNFFGEIDLDPCADPGHRVPAHMHYTAQENGLLRPWRGRVYLNPPYGDILPAWITKALYAPIEELIMLLPARTDTKAFQLVFAQCPAICFIAGRLHFVAGVSPAPLADPLFPDALPAAKPKPSKASIQAPFPSVLTYKGPRVDAFRAHFAKLGPMR